MNGVTDSNDSDFVEADPTGRYWRYNEILGKGSSKTVFRAFDEYEGIEVAWNQVKLGEFLQGPEDLERLYREIHLLKTLKHGNIMKFYTSWVDTPNRRINFVTEMFTSGTLRQYRLKHRRMNIRAIKNWCRQILQGLVYLHSHDPPIIHRDLKCDNIFINGNQGQVKIGDLGLAAILKKSHVARCVGTPEFMAPEVYEEEYNELVDIYSFGMCFLEMLTFEYPYSECTHPAQIYKKVISGKKPDALYTVKEPMIRIFIEKCLAKVSQRLSAWELLNDPFLRIDDHGCDLMPGNYDETDTLVRNPLLTCYDPVQDSISDYEADIPENVEISIQGESKEDGNVFLGLRIADKEGCIRNIYFNFDIEIDTALSVATEMVAELDITDQDVTRIARLLHDEIGSLVPEWKRSYILEESLSSKNMSYCKKCHPDDSSPDKAVRCRHGCGTVHGRFEEFTYKFHEDQHVVHSDPITEYENGNESNGGVKATE